MKKYIYLITIFMLFITFFYNGISYADVGDCDEIIRKYLANEALTQDEVNKLKNEKVTSTFYDSSTVDMAVEAAKSGTIKMSNNNSNNQSSSNNNQSSSNNQNNTSNVNKAKGAEYWHSDRIQTPLDMFQDYKTFNSSDIQAIDNYLSNATFEDMQALTSTDVDKLINILDAIGNNSDNLKQEDPQISKRLERFALNLQLVNNNGQHVASDSQKNSLKSIQQRFAKVGEIASAEENNQNVINNPNTGVVNPDDIQIVEDDKYHSSPSTGGLGNASGSTSHTPDEIIQEGDSFLNAGNGQAPINGESLTSASSTLYNILLSIGMFSAIAIGVYLGVKFMTSSVEEKAKVKESLIPYICGCVVIFGAFIIWKLVIGLLSAIG